MTGAELATKTVNRETELLAVYPVADVCRWFGHSPAVAARFYAQSRTEVADRACNERTLDDVPATDIARAHVGHIDDKTGANTEHNSNHQAVSGNHQKSEEPLEKQAILMDSDGLWIASDETISGRYWTRTNDPHDVNVVL